MSPIRDGQPDLDRRFSCEPKCFMARPFDPVLWRLELDGLNFGVGICGSVKGATIAISGLTFKPSTDDAHDTFSIAIIKYFQDAGA